MRLSIRRSLFLVPLSLLFTAAPAAAPAENRSENPHGTFVADCTQCHSKEAWKPVLIGPTFVHAPKRFPLMQAHATVACRACHATLDFKQSKSACVDCHQDVHRGELGSDCAACHTTRNFIERADSTRRHRLTRFPLLGAHAPAECSQCHRPAASGQATYVNTPTNCDACHLADYNAAKNPDHVAGGFPRDCEECHGQTAWLSTAFNHSATGFALDGAHRGVTCSRCHPGNQFTGTSPDCFGCHQADYTGTTNPAHASAGFSTDCRSCHNTKAWIPSTFNHAVTGFSLTGAHVSLVCTSCHTGGVYSGLNPACASCHLDDYNGTTDPAHAAAGFPTDCDSCHTTTTWSGARFDHDSTFFPIYSGVHKGRWSSCSTCHINSSNYADFSCFGCHPHDDKAGTDSHHQAVSGYSYDSRACYTCHPRGTH